MISTDGVSCSVLLIRRDYVGKNVPAAVNKSISNERYVDEITERERVLFKDHTIVAIDPNMRDLLYCVDSDGKEQFLKTCACDESLMCECVFKWAPIQNKYRYTKSTRNKEAKACGYRKLLKMKKENHVFRDGVTIKDCEDFLCDFSLKTMDLESYKLCVEMHNEVRFNYLNQYYSDRIYRKLRFSGYIGRQISEARMINNFKAKFGGPSEAVVCIGDWSRDGHHMKYHEPTKGKGFRDTFRRAGYKAFLVD